MAARSSAPQAEWHRLAVDQVLEMLNSSRQGLTTEEVESRRERYGPNEIEREEPISPVAILLRQIKDPLVYILLIAAAVALVLQDYTDATVIAAVVVINSIVGFTQEYKAEKAMRALAKLTVPRARVVREGREVEVDSRDLVPGDIVFLESGMRVPADLRVIHAVELSVDNSILTGESSPARKSSDTVDDPGLAVGDRFNITYMGTTVARGRAYGVVVATGPDTELGHIGASVSEVAEISTPLQARLADFGRILGIAILGLAALTFILGIMADQPLLDMFLTAVSIAVAAIPEGLPVVVTIALAVGVSRMAARQAIVRKLPAVEALGSTTVIGSDKTGTLTRNEMTVRKIYAAGRIYDVEGTGYEPFGRITRDGAPLDGNAPEPLLLTLRIGLLANESDVYKSDGRYQVRGDPTEGALIVAAAKAGLIEEAEEEAFPQVDLLPFESDRRYMATLNAVDGARWLLVKGAPGRVIEMCDQELMDGRTVPLDREALALIEQDLASEGLRVLAMAYKEFPPDTNEFFEADVRGDLIFVGMQAMMDPPRDEAIDAVARAQEAGIRVAMITGDDQTTAQAIARRMGIGEGRAVALTGRDIEAMSDEELYALVTDTAIYARVSPEHKLRIVQQLQRRGEIVAVTGDGVNDAAALKQAHIGVAMGKTGTDVAREASDIVLSDDNFASIVAAVEEGRIAFENIRKAIFFLIPTGIGFVIALLASLVAGLPVPFLPAQILWVNLVTNGLQDVALAFEPKEEDVLRRPPRRPEEGIFNRLMLERSALVGLVLVTGTMGVFLWQLAEEVPIEQARTAAITTVVLFQLYHLFNSRSFRRSILQMSPFSNRLLFVSAVGGIAIHLLALHWGPLQALLRFRPLPLDDWLIIAAVGFSIIVVVELDKLVRRRIRT